MTFHSHALLMFSVLTLFAPQSVAQQPSVRDLFEQIRVETTTKDATEQFLKIRPDDPEARKYLAVHLLPLIKEDPKEHPHAWMNEVRLAGAFKITEAMAALTKWIGLPMSDSPGGSLAERTRLEPFPAGRALVQIGEPAVPTLTAVLERTDWRERWVAYRALDMIGTPSAIKALRAHVDHEPDQTLKSEMRQALGVS
jgi:HEAT repeats